jgi:hypothetical protein
LLLKKSIPFGLLVVSTGTALLLGELLVRFALNPGDFLAGTTIDDPVLGHRIKPYSTGHDALGYRNPEVPEHANVVAIGDSVTYGVMAARNRSWPHQLGALLHEPVYNMALGGYGPLQYLHLARHEAKKLRPRLLLVGFYFGNDLIDAYRVAHQSPYWQDWREVGKADRDISQYRHSANSEPRKLFADFRDWLSGHSVFYNVVKVTLLARLALWEQDRIASRVTPDRQMIWTDPSRDSVRTIFTPRVSLSALDTRLPIVQEGLRITKRALISLKSDADAQGVKLLVVLIPTKERAYCRYLKNSGSDIPDTFLRLCDVEEQVKRDLMRFFATRTIAYVDVSSAIEEQIEKHVQIYPKNSDTHPQAAGYGVLARVVYDAIRRLEYEN